MVFQPPKPEKAPCKDALVQRSQPPLPHLLDVPQVWRITLEALTFPAILWPFMKSPVLNLLSTIRIIPPLHQLFTPTCSKRSTNSRTDQFPNIPAVGPDDNFVIGRSAVQVRSSAPSFSEGEAKPRESACGQQQDFGREG